jgi:DNA-binding response OmpR family regulator
MPVMGGTQLIRELRRRGARFPVIASSGETPGDEPSAADIEGSVVRLAKPFALDELLSAIARSLREPPQNPPGPRLGKP